MEWFLYDSNLRHERVNSSNITIKKLYRTFLVPIQGRIRICFDRVEPLCPPTPPKKKFTQIFPMLKKINSVLD